MDHSTGAGPRPPCPCCAARATTSPARNVAELIAAHPAARFLDAEADTLALILPQFETATATTVGPAMLLTQHGGYAPPRRAGGRLDSPPGRIALRLAAGRGERIAFTPADPARREPAALHLFDASGRLAHRCQIAAPGDLATLAAVLVEIPVQAPPEPAQRRPEPLSAAIPCLPAIRRARDAFAEADLSRHIDDFVLDGGRARRTCLPHVGGGARRIDPRMLRPLLGEIAERRLPFRRLAARPGCVQMQEGALDTLGAQGELLLMRSGPCLMALDLSCLADAFATRLGAAGRPAGAIEVYDSDGFCAAALLPSPSAATDQLAAWNALLESLPASRPTAQPVQGARG